MDSVPSRSSRALTVEELGRALEQVSQPSAQASAALKHKVITATYSRILDGTKFRAPDPELSQGDVLLVEMRSRSTSCSSLTSCPCLSVPIQLQAIASQPVGCPRPPESISAEGVCLCLAKRISTNPCAPSTYTQEIRFLLCATYFSRLAEHGSCGCPQFSSGWLCTA